jgi:hypothetical protein
VGTNNFYGQRQRPATANTAKAKYYKNPYEQIKNYYGGLVF